MAGAVAAGGAEAEAEVEAAAVGGTYVDVETAVAEAAGRLKAVVEGALTTSRDSALSRAARLVQTSCQQSTRFQVLFRALTCTPKTSLMRSCLMNLQTIPCAAGKNA